MILTCPECRTQFSINPAALGTSGRTVRCTRCAATWHQQPAPETAIPPAKAPESPVPAYEPPPPSARELPPAAASDQDEEETVERLGIPLDGPISPPLSEATQASVVRRAALIVAALLIPLLLLGGAIYGLRNSLVTNWPASARLYQMLGISVAGTPYPFEFRGVSTAKGDADGKPTLVVAGEIANASNEPQAVPRLKIILHSKDRDLPPVEFSAMQTQLKPGESAHFQTIVPQPAPDATSATLTIVTAQ
jgi:predicted Zn finger-like uncharacterized protein